MTGGRQDAHKLSMYKSLLTNKIYVQESFNQ
jgi:hypothetical protein